VPRELAAVASSVPTAGRARVAMRTRGGSVAPHALRAPAARQLRSLRSRGEIPAEIVVASGMRSMPRQGRTAPGWLAHGRREGGTPGREKYMTAQCAANRMWVAPGAVPGDSVEIAFSTVHRRAVAVCAQAGAVANTAREPRVFHDWRGRQVRGDGRALGNAVPQQAARGHRASRACGWAEAARPGVEDPRRAWRVAPHAMAVAKRRKPEGESPEGAHIAFAASSPSFDAKSVPAPVRD